jgi:hypothetical protein
MTFSKVASVGEVSLANQASGVPVLDRPGMWYRMDMLQYRTDQGFATQRSQVGRSRTCDRESAARVL